MALGDKPAKQPEWNSGLSNQAEPTSGEKTAGFVVGQVAPSNIINWLLYTLYEWTRWVASYTSTSTGHVHDGGSNETGTSPSAPKVDFNDHINYGTNGSLEITTDTGSVYEVTVNATGTSRITLDSVYVDTVDAPGGTLTINDDTQVTGTIESTATGLGFIGTNAPVILATIDSAGTVVKKSGFTSVSKTGTGTYTLVGNSVGASEEWVVSATIEGTSTSGMITWYEGALGYVNISTFDDTGAPADRGFSVVAYKI